MKPFLYSAMLGLALVGTAAAESWPQFRGPGGQGHSRETNLPLHWSQTSNIVWKTDMSGESWSSPVVWEEKVFVTTTRENGAQCHVICLERDTGKVLWDKAVFEQVPRRKEDKNSFATPTPVTDGKQVYAVFGDGSLVALKMDGTVLWTNRDTKFYSKHGLGASPIVYGDLVIMPFDGSSDGADLKLGWQIPWDKAVLLALDKQTGQVKWEGTRGLSRIAHVTPLVMSVEGKDQLVSGAGDVMQGFDLKTGERLWSARAQGEGVVPSPVTGEGMIFASSGFEKTTLRAFKPNGRGEVTATHIAWEQRKGVPTQPSPLYVKPYLYTLTDGGGLVSCFRPESGEVIWQERVGGNFSASPVYGDGKIYLLSEAGETTVIAAGPEFKVLAKNPLGGERSQASMAVSAGRLFVRTEKALYCIGNRN